MPSPDWAGLSGSSTASRYRDFADEAEGVSPSYQRLCRGIAGDDLVLALLDELPLPKRQPNLLLGAVRNLGGPLGGYRELRDWLTAHWPDLAATMLAHRTQTNEPRRCATWLPALPRGPIALLEVGASAGLCLFPDRYAYRFATPDGMRELGSSPVLLDCDALGAVPIPAALPEIVWRAGLDLHPLDVTDEQDVRWLESLIWPEERDRFGRLREAIRIARREPPRIVAGDLVTDLAGLAAEAPETATLVVVHSAVLAYVAEAGRRAFTDAVHALAAQRPTCWLSNEAPGVLPGTDVATGAGAQFVLARDGVPVAVTGPHGGSVRWPA